MVTMTTLGTCYNCEGDQVNPAIIPMDEMPTHFEEGGEISSPAFDSPVGER